MKVTYDPNRNISYVEVKDSCEKVKTIKLSWEVSIDIASDGKVCRIKLLDAKEQLKILDGNVYLRINDLVLLIEKLIMYNKGRRNRRTSSL